MRRMMIMLGGFVGLLLLVVSPTVAGKGGGGNPGTPADYSVAVASGPAGGTITLMNADGSATKALKNLGIDVAHWRWHPDGDKLLVSSPGPGPEGIYTVDMNGSASLVVAVDLSPGAWPCMSRVPSPTGSRLITYVGYDSDLDETLYVCNEDGTNPIALLTESSGVYLNGPVFHAGGDVIALSRKDTNATLNGWKLILVGLAFDGDGNAVVSYVTQLTPGSPLELGDTLGPAFSNSGDILAVAHNVDDIWFIDMDTLGMTNVTNGRVPLVTMGGWNAADDIFYFSGRSGRYTTVHTIDTNGNITDLGARGYKPKCRMP